MQISTDAAHPDGARMLRLTGEVDIGSVDELRSALDDVLTGRPPAVTVDLTDVTFFDSAGLRALDDAAASAREFGSTIRLRGAQPTVRRLLEITGLESRFVLDRTDARDPRPGSDAG